MAPTLTHPLASLRRLFSSRDRAPVAAPLAAKGTGWIVSSDEDACSGSDRNAYAIARELGHPALVFVHGMDPDQFLERHPLRALVLGKAFDSSFVALARAAKARGIAVLAAMCDWHFDSQVNLELSRLANRIVVQTEMMAAGVRTHFGVAPIIIEEPYEGPRGEPRFAPLETVRLVWYGHSNNLDTLVPGLDQVARAGAKDLLVSIVTERPDMAKEVLSRLPAPESPMRCVVHPFSLARQWRELADCDAVLLPSRPAREKLVKGHGRLVHAIHSGRLALAFPLPQYEELADFCWCGADLGVGLRWALQNPGPALERIRSGQAYVDTRFSPRRIAQRWAEELARV